MLLVFIQGSRPNRLQFTPRQGWLQNIGGIDGPFSTPSTNQGMQLINEEDDMIIDLNLFNNLLQAVFKLTTILGASNQLTHVEDHQTLVG